MKTVLMAAGVAALLATGAQAEVKSVTPQGFEAVESYAVRAPPDKLYQAMLHPERWWSSDHTFSGSAANLSLDVKPGGCFCETLKDGGFVQHMTVAYAAPGKMLRLRGALGPLGGEGVDGAMTFTLTPAKDGTQLVVDLTVGGYFKTGVQDWAPVVDGVLALQTSRLKRYTETGSLDAPKSSAAKP